MSMMKFELEIIPDLEMHVGVRREYICKTNKMHVFVFSAKSSSRFNPLSSVKDSHLK